MKHPRLLLLLSFLMVMSVGIAPMCPLVSAAPVSAPRVKVKEGTSTNWSGYAVETNFAKPASNAVTDVKGTWVVPAVTCLSSLTTYSSVWVGIDGYSSNSVEQTGTEQDCYLGTPRYSAWYEMYPKMPVTLSISVKPGDSITAEVKSGGSSQFTLTLTNNSANKSFTTTQKTTKARRQSAEWIVEAPYSGGVLPLADFGTVTITGASATLNGVAGTISNWPNDAMTMVNDSGSPKAVPSSLSSNGSSFSVAWAASN